MLNRIRVRGIEFACMIQDEREFVAKAEEDRWERIDLVDSGARMKGSSMRVRDVA